MDATFNFKFEGNFQGQERSKYFIWGFYIRAKFGPQSIYLTKQIIFMYLHQTSVIDRQTFRLKYYIIKERFSLKTVFNLK